MSVKFWGKVLDDYAFLKVDEFEHWYQNTYFHGRCEVFKVDLEMAMNDYITFTVGKGKEVLVYFLEPGEDFFLSTQTFLSPSTVVDIKGSMIIKLKWVSLLIVFFSRRIRGHGHEGRRYRLNTIRYIGKNDLRFEFSGLAN